MGWRRLSLALAVLAVVTAAVPARADVAIPLTGLVSYLWVALALVIVVIEAPFLRLIARLSWRRALVYSLAANAASTLVGVPISFASGVFLQHPLTDVVAIPILFGATVAVEYALLRWRLGPAVRRLLAAVVLMNILSYSILVAGSIGWVVIEQRAKKEHRYRAMEAYREARSAQVVESADGSGARAMGPDAGARRDDEP
jgi:hypothetical protein